MSVTYTNAYPITTTRVDRRYILKAGVSATALLFSPNLVRAQHHHHATSQHGGMMHHMPHGNNHATRNNLLALDRMPSKQALQPLPRLKNISSEKNLFKADLTAAPSKKTVANRSSTEFWLYNNQLPGPLIDVFEGDTVEIRFKNNLPEPTTVHWHGLPVPPDQDGNPQDPVAPNAEKIYRFTLPKGSAGTYWYHPHPHGQTAMQVARGLAGTFIVRAKDDPLADWPEQHWMITDLRLNQQTQIPPNTMMDWMNGREGQFVLINGQLQPTITLTTGTRIRIWNNCSARYLRLALPNCQWIVLGTDGGLLEAPRPPQKELFLAPAERIEVVLVSAQEQQAQLVSHYYDRQKMMVSEPHTDTLLANIHLQISQNSLLPSSLRPIPHLGTPTSTQNVEFSEAEMNHDHAMSMDMMHNLFFINGRVFDMDRVDFTSRVGEVEEWRIFNNSHMDHPFHLHGTQFIVTQREQNGQITPEPFKAWRDTVNLRPYETVTFHVKQDKVGRRMLHCHILEHEDLGMMANLEVI